MIIYWLGVGTWMERAPDSILKEHHLALTERYANGIPAALQALKIAEEKGYNDFKMQALRILVIAYEEKGDFKNAYKDLSSLISLRDSVTGVETQKKIAQNEAKYVYEKKAAVTAAAQEKKDIKHRLVRNSLLTGFGLLAFFSLVVIRQRNRVNKEKKRSEALLLNILPSAVASELKETGKAAAQRFDHISVLFTDFVNFTGTAEALSAEDIVRKLNECFTAFDNIMERHGLEKIKTIGDAYMAVCGLPVAKSDHALRTIAAAKDILDFMRKRSKEQDSFGIRIGINSGSVVAGIVGVKKFAYDIWGDTVNTAARIEQNSFPGKINISESTYDLVKDVIPCIYRGEIEAKNKGRLKMYFVEE
jgi:class 3 adenylate cyclase